MSKPEGFPTLDSHNAATIGDRAENLAGLFLRNVPRQKLADISNLPQKPKLLIQDDKLQAIPETTKEYIEQLQKENMALVKMLGQKNKIIEQSGIELERLRANLIKVQDQNRQLALSHTQVLTELNTGKDRLKSLQHELGCKRGLLNARKLELEDKDSVTPFQHADAEENLIKLQEEGESSKGGEDDEKPCKTKKRLRSRSLGSSQPVQSKMNAGNERPIVRRQSARYKAVELKHVKDLVETDDIKFPKCSLPGESVLENRSTSVHLPVKHEDSRSCFTLKRESQEFGRSSLCRPSRLAAKKVQSYKEIPLNVKMRRSE